jgi:hypothetical protein
MRPAIILTALLALSACNKDKSTTVTTADGKEVKITTDGGNTAENGTITFEGKDGEGGKITFGADAAKQGLPMGLPLYPGGEVKGAFAGGDTGEKAGMVTVMTSDPPAKVIEFYKAEAAKRGFDVQGTATANNMVSFTAKGKDNSSVMVTATPGEGGKTAAMIIGSAKN